jgi:hypothetical protein
VDHDIALATIAVLPQLILLSVGAVLAIRYRGPLGAFLSTRTSSISAFGFRMDLKPSDVAAAVTAKVAVSGDDTKLLDLAGSSQAIVDRASPIGATTIRPRPRDRPSVDMLTAP